MDIGGIVSEIESSGALQPAAQKAGLEPDKARSILKGLLEHAQQGGGAEGMADAMAAKMGVSPQEVQALLPHVMPLLQRHAQASTDTHPELGGLVGSVGALLGA